jgi:hypothetical protein
VKELKGLEASLGGVITRRALRPGSEDVCDWVRLCVAASEVVGVVVGVVVKRSAGDSFLNFAQMEHGWLLAGVVSTS